MDSYPHSYETYIFTLSAPHEEVQGGQTKLHPGFTLGKLVQPSLNSCRIFKIPHCSVQAVIKLKSGGVLKLVVFCLDMLIFINIKLCNCQKLKINLPI